MGSTELLGRRGDDVEERNCGSLLSRQKSPKNAQPNNNGICRNEKTEQSGENRAEVPLGPSGSTGLAVVPLRSGGSTGLRGLFVPGRNFEPKISRFRGANGKIRARNARDGGAITQAMKSLDQNHKKLTQTRDRSRDQGGAFY